MIILGIDPGTALVGFGVIKKENQKCVFVGCGVIDTGKEKNEFQRLLLVAEALETLIKKYQPDYMGIEKLFFSKNVKTALTVSQARGVILMTATKIGVPILESSPQDVKMSVAGYGAAGKKQVQKMVTVLLGLSSVPKPDDAADALAVALSVAPKIKNPR